ncbi:MAG: hypothetical protein UW95_C0006G0043 [Parcubacteria group bacterium GW2011_GWC1_45_14]|nr:MAG: hypothetical protein UW87_C0013G0006 [Candidatus Moranbacteria bacterium GW2011_GWC2_45_10]KKT94978.1 MAG: hypothetical protein UW95_C0006G0043 [Parcubacteria group bacterium GW2011_GWC1_45_14]
MAEKLVRDKIVEIRTREEGIVPKHRILESPKERLKYIRRKILEEVRELARAKTREQVIEEVVDLQDSVRALLKELGIGLLEVEKARMEKKKKKGEFGKGIVMEIPPVPCKMREKRKKNETSGFFSEQTVLLTLLRTRDWKRFVECSHGMPDKAALWDVLEKVDPKLLADLFVFGAEAGFVEKLFGYDAERTVKVLHRFEKNDIARICSVTSEKENILILRNTGDPI